MKRQSFGKVLTANDTGKSGSHQAGIHIHKSQHALIAMLPKLDPSTKNPSAWVVCRCADAQEWLVRYIHYNNKLHDAVGTRDEYRLTHLARFLSKQGAGPGDLFQISKVEGVEWFEIRLIKGESRQDEGALDAVVERVRLRGWQRMH